MSVHYNVNLHLNDNSLCPTIIQAQVHESISIFIDVNDLNVTDTSKLFPINFCGLIKNKLGNFKIECSVESADANVDTGEVYYNSTTNQIIIRCNDITKMKGDMICELYFYNGYTDNDTYLITNPFIIEIAETAMDTPGDEMPDLDATYAEMKQMLKDYNDGKLGGMTEEEKEDFANMKNSITSLTNKLNSHSVNADMAFSDIRAVQDKNTQKIETLESSVNALDTSNVDGLLYENEYLYLTAKDEVVGDGVHIVNGTSSGGTGEGSGNSAVLTLKNTSGWISKSISSGEQCLLNFEWSSLEDEMETGIGSLSVYVNNLLKLSKNIEQGAITLDITDYISVGSNTIKIKVTDMYNNSRTINYKVNIMDLNITSSFDTSSPYFDAFSFPYVATGELSKTVHFKVDGIEIGTAVVPTSGRQLTFAIPAQTHGTHSIEAYFDCEINGETITSNHIYYEFAFAIAGNNTPIITSNFTSTVIKQYDTISINYKIYNPASMYCDAELLVNNVSVSALTVDRTEQFWSYQLNNTGTTIMTIKAGAATKTFNIVVEESEINVVETTDAMSLKLISQGRSNSEMIPNKWEYGDIKCQFNKFTFESDGWVQDDDGVTVLRIMNDARLIIPYKPFESDCKTIGKTIEIEFATHAISDYETPMISCMSGGRGFEFTPQKVTFASEQTKIQAQYKEDDHNRVSFVVEKTSENKLILCYLDAVMCYPTQYAKNDDFSQIAPVNISIGSNGCITDIYAIRIYNNNLTRYQILDNWIFDTADGKKKLERYIRNNIFDAYDQILMGNLPQYLPYMVLKAAELPQYKGDKKTVDGYYVDKLNPSKNFTFTNAQFDVQGTSSQFYTRKNYKMKIDKTSGIILADGSQVFKYQLRDGMMPERTFCLKADVASSEGVNNTQLVRYYNDICPYKTPYQIADPRCRQGIDGFPIVIFWNDGNTTQFIGKYNFNLDKSDEDTFGFQEGDESWETLNNTSNRALYKDDDFSTNEWTADYEARYPEDNLDASNLANFIGWVKSTDRTQATDSALAASITLDGVEYTTDSADYRLAKFKAELSEHAHINDLIFYYLFTETFLQIDSRAKNSFPSILGDKLWMIMPYDMDTSMGINNEGQLVFGPFLEDIDQVGAMDVFNGQNSVLWTNLRDAFHDDIKSMYGELRSSGTFSFDYINNRINEQQGKWSEAIFNEDGYFKYLEPLILDNDASYLGMALGDKKKQRAYWLYNRFKYLDAKYNAGDSAKDVITLRAYSKANITVTPYVDTYATVAFTTPYTVSIRAKANTAYEMVCKLDNVNDSEFYIYNASNIKDVGDLSPLHVGYADFTKATKLQHLKLGDGAADYSNPNLGLTDNSKVSLGNNILLKDIDIRNCANLSGNFDVSGCINIESILLEGTKITGVSLPNACPIQTLHLPSTITNLELVNQSKLSDITPDSFSNLTTFIVKNANKYLSSKLLNLVHGMASNTKLRLLGINMNLTGLETSQFINDLRRLKGIDVNGNYTDFPQVSGRLYALTIYQDQIDFLNTNCPDLEVIYGAISEYPLFSYDKFLAGISDKTTITKITFSTTINDSDDIETGWDVSKAQDGAMMCYPQKTNTNSLKIYNPFHGKICTLSGYFEGFSALSTVDFGSATIDLSESSRCTALCSGCKKLTKFNMSNINVGRNVITSTGDFFRSCSSLKKLDLGKFDFYISDGGNCGYMLNGTTKLKTFVVNSFGYSGGYSANIANGTDSLVVVINSSAKPTLNTMSTPWGNGCIFLYKDDATKQYYKNSGNFGNYHLLISDYYISKSDIVNCSVTKSSVTSIMFVNSYTANGTETKYTLTTNFNGHKIYGYYYNGAFIINLNTSSDKKVYIPDLSASFTKFPNIIKITGLDNLDVSLVTTIFQMTMKCTKLTEFIAPSWKLTNKVVSLGNAFYVDGELMKIDLRNSDIMNPGTWGFIYCSPKIIDARFHTIGYSSSNSSAGFGDNTGNSFAPNDLYFYSPTPAVMNFAWIKAKSSLKIHIPKGSLNNYTSATNWANYADYYVEDL